MNIERMAVGTGESKTVTPMYSGKPDKPGETGIFPNALHNRAEIGPEFITHANPLRFVRLFQG